MVEPRSCKEQENQQPEKRGEQRRTGRDTQSKNQEEQQGQQEKASIKHMFDLAIDCSDAESKVGQRLSGVPPWETRRECTNELIGSDLEHENLGRHP